MFDAIDKNLSKPRRYHEDIIAAIREMVRRGELAVGQTIPSERELAVQFNVSRVPVREALKILEYLGVFENIRGEGMVLRGLDVAELYEKLDFAVAFDERALRDLFEARLLLEPEAARLAARRRGEEHLMVLARSVEQMEKSPGEEEGLGEGFYEASALFHEEIFRAAQNAVLLALYKNLSASLKLSKGITLSQEQRLAQPLQYHQRILEALRKKDGEEAAALMRQHLLNAEESALNE